MTAGSQQETGAHSRTPCILLVLEIQVRHPPRHPSSLQSVEPAKLCQAQGHSKGPCSQAASSLFSVCMRNRQKSNEESECDQGQEGKTTERWVGFHWVLRDEVSGRRHWTAAGEKEAGEKCPRKNTHKSVPWGQLSTCEELKGSKHHLVPQQRLPEGRVRDARDLGSHTWTDASCQQRTLWGFKWRSDTTGVHFRTFVAVTWGRQGTGEGGVQGRLGLHSEFSVIQSSGSVSKQVNE